MAKKSEQPAASRDTAIIVGEPTGFLAEEEHLDRVALLRLGTWGVATVAAVVVAVLASQSSMKVRRDQVTAADLARQSQQVQSLARESGNEARRLASAIDTLNGDRDRLFSRVSALEQGLDSVTGSIARQSVAAVAPLAPFSSFPAPASALPPVAQHPAPVTPPVPAPVAAPVATATAATTERPKAETRSPDPAPAPKAVATAAPVTSSPPPPEAPAASLLTASKPMMAPPDVAAGKQTEPEPHARSVAVTPAAAPLPAVATSAPVAMRPPAPAVVASTSMIGPPAPPMVVAAVPPADTAGANTAKPAVAPLAVKRTEFAVDLGGANSVGGLRALWRGLLKTRSNAPLAALQPIIVIKEAGDGLGMQLRLVAGPLTDAAAAAKICATMIANQRPCETTVFDGQRLAMKAEPSSASADAVSRKPDLENSDPATSDLAKSDSSKPDLAKPDLAKPVAGSTSEKPARSSWHRRSYPKRAVIEEPAPKPPEPTSTLSSFFIRRPAQ